MTKGHKHEIPNHHSPQEWYSKTDGTTRLLRGTNELPGINFNFGQINFINMCQYVCVKDKKINEISTHNQLFDI